MAWTPEVVELFRDTKAYITSSPTFSGSDPGKPTFLEKDWIAEGMG